MGKQNYYYNDTQDNPCITFCAKSRTKYITLTTILVVIALGIGFGIGFSIKKIETKFSNSSSSEGEQLTQTNTSRSSSTTTVKPLPVRTCPPTLSQPITSNVLLSLDKTIDLTTFKRYVLDYISPANVVNAMLMFEFNTIWGSWYLDDVSMKESGGNNQEIIDNSGFEIGNLGLKWSFCDPRYPWIEDGTIVNHTSHLGKYSYESKDPGVGSQEYLTQILNIKSKTRYTIEFYVFCSGEPDSAQVTIISSG